MSSTGIAHRQRQAPVDRRRQPGDHGRYSLAALPSRPSDCRRESNLQRIGDIGCGLPRGRRSVPRRRSVVGRGRARRGAVGARTRGARVRTASAGDGRGRERARRACDVPRGGAGAAPGRGPGPTPRGPRAVARGRRSAITVGARRRAAGTAGLGLTDTDRTGAAGDGTGRAAADMEPGGTLPAAHRAGAGLAQGDTALRLRRGRGHRRVRPVGHGPRTDGSRRRRAPRAAGTHPRPGLLGGRRRHGRVRGTPVRLRAGRADRPTAAGTGGTGSSAHSCANCSTGESSWTSPTKSGTEHGS